MESHRIKMGKYWSEGCEGGGGQAVTTALKAAERVGKAGSRSSSFRPFRPRDFSQCGQACAEEGSTQLDFKW